MQNQAAVFHLLRHHPILGYEIFSGKGDDLGIARMIHRFQPNDAIFHVMVVRMHVLDQVEPGLSGPNTRISLASLSASTTSW